MSDNDTALILATNMLKEVAELPASDLRDNELRGLCNEVLDLLNGTEAPIAEAK